MKGDVGSEPGAETRVGICLKEEVSELMRSIMTREPVWKNVCLKYLIASGFPKLDQLHLTPWGSFYKRLVPVPKARNSDSVNLGWRAGVWSVF